LADSQTLSARVGNGVDGLNLNTNVSVSVSTWHHVILLFDDTKNEYRLYFDGEKVLEEKVADDWQPVRGSGPLSLGTWPRYRSYFCGALSEIAIWERSLGDNEIQQLYETASDGKSYCTAIGESTKQNDE